MCVYHYDIYTICIDMGYKVILMYNALFLLLCFNLVLKLTLTLYDHIVR